MGAKINEKLGKNRVDSQFYCIGNCGYFVHECKTKK